MKKRCCPLTGCSLIAVACLLGPNRHLRATDPAASVATPPLTTAEARGRAELLHETFHAVLQVVHHQYYREDEGLAIPAATLKKVFHELAKRRNVEMRWLAVNATPMNQDHLPHDAFERAAVAALAAGQDAYESVDEGTYRRAAAITLTSECLKCHAPNRSSTKDRVAGLSISLPLLGVTPSTPPTSQD